MGKQIFTVKGIQSDISQSKSSNEYATYMKNLRVVTNEEGQNFSLVSEKGNSAYTINWYYYHNGEKLTATNPLTNNTIKGYCVISKYLVLFVHGTATDYICRLEPNQEDDLTLDGYILYDNPLGFDEGIIQTLQSFENSAVIKVYWVDGKHQPRLINISDPTKKDFWENQINPFDFTPAMKFQESVNIDKVGISGIFPGGVIQYILTYYNKNGQETNAFYSSPLYYTAFNERGASPEESVSNAFQIRVINPDDTFEYIRVYSILRTSENGTPICKNVYNIPLDSKEHIPVTETSFDFTSFQHSDTTSQFTDVKVFKVSDSLLGGILLLEEVPIIRFYDHRDTNSNIYYKVINHGTYTEEYPFVPAGQSSQVAIGYVTTDYVVVAYTGNSSNGRDNVVMYKVSSNNSSQNLTGNVVIKETQSGFEISSTSNNTTTKGTIGVSTSETLVDAVSIVDNGMIGESVDYSEILYLEKQEIHPTTLTQKSNTLFLGNIEYVDIRLASTDIDTIQQGTTIDFVYGDYVNKGALGSSYMYKNQLEWDTSKITTFKGGESYTFGIRLQDNLGIWTEIIPLTTVTNSLYPLDRGANFNPVKASLTFNSSARTIISRYKRVKVYILEAENRVVCQGVISPTLFDWNRREGTRYAQSSWFFRYLTEDSQSYSNGDVMSKHNYNLPTTEDGGEIQEASRTSIDYSSSSTLSHSDKFVDWTLLGLYSPEIEFENVLSQNNLGVRIVGIVPITASQKDVNILLDTIVKDGDNINSNWFQYTGERFNNIDDEGYKFDIGKYVIHNGNYKYPIYPWQRDGSVVGQVARPSSGDWNGLLGTKVMSELKQSAYTDYIINNFDNVSTLEYLCPTLTVFNGSQDTILHESNPYAGNIDEMISPTGKNLIYKDSSDTVHYSSEDNAMAIRIKYKSGTHGLINLKDSIGSTYIPPNVEGDITAGGGYNDIVVYKWIGDVIDGTGLTYNSSPLQVVNNAQLVTGDFVILENTNNCDDYIWVITGTSGNMITITPISTTYINNHNIEGSKWFAYRSPSEITYYRLLVTTSTHHESGNGHGGGGGHVVVEYSTTGKYDTNDVRTFTLTEGILQNTLTIPSSLSSYRYTYLVELYKPEIVEPSLTNAWKSASTPQETNSGVILANIGDTFYQRYDCLKTYPYTLQDQNQIVEILSFMCETRINIDGRYDKNRGIISRTMTKEIFNLLNRAYTNHDMFTTYWIDDSKRYTYNNEVLWSLTKNFGAEIDVWTKINAASTLDLDGDKGSITKLINFNDTLLCFQTSGVSRILYNERVNISPSDNIPIEIANSGKVGGYVYLSSNNGSTNINGFTQSSEGLYYIDTYVNDLIKFDGRFNFLGTSLFNLNNINSLDLKTGSLYYEPLRRNIYLLDEDNCLCYNEILNTFVGFFDYNDSILLPYDDTYIAIHNSSIWRQYQDDDYLKFFGETEDCEIVLTSAERPTEDKIFTNVEFRADILDGNSLDSNTQSSTASINTTPFDYIQAWNEYQDTDKKSLSSMIRMGSNLSQKFRIWRASIPNDSTKKLDRIRNPWMKIRLSKENCTKKLVVHDIGIVYV